MMISGYLVELLVFAAVAFLVISKLISTLGSTYEDEAAKRQSFFGEPKNELKDVTTTANAKNNTYYYDDSNSLKGLLLEKNQEEIIRGFIELKNKFPQFKPDKFLRNAKVAFQMIIEAKEDNLELLIDKRYIEKFKSLNLNYVNINLASLCAYISEIYMFGNNAFIKILFCGKNVVSNIEYFNEEWTFSRSLIQKGNDWYLTNIDSL